jgi:hypothetical protein
LKALATAVSRPPSSGKRYPFFPMKNQPLFFNFFFVLEYPPAF